MGTLGPEQQKEPRYQVNYHMYPASGRRLSCTPSVERVVGWTIHEMQPVLQIFTIFRLCHLTWERYQVLPDFPYCKRRKAGPGLGMRLANQCMSAVVNILRLNQWMS